MGPTAASFFEMDNEVFISDQSRVAYNELIEVADSLHPAEISVEMMREVIEERSNALLFTDETCDFYKAELGIVPEESEIQAIRLLRRILYILKRNNPSKHLKNMLNEVTAKL